MKNKKDHLRDALKYSSWGAVDSGIDARDLLPSPGVIQYAKAVERPSTMRAMAMISLIVGAGIAFLGIYRSEDLTSLAVLCGVFVAPAFAGKAVQKHIEVKGSKNEK